MHLLTDGVKVKSKFVQKQPAKEIQLPPHRLLSTEQRPGRHFVRCFVRRAETVLTKRPQRLQRARFWPFWSTTFV